MIKTGNFLDRLCTLCAVVFCGLIVLQNLAFIGGRGQWFSLLSLIFTGGIVLLAVRCLPVKIGSAHV